MAWAVVTKTPIMWDKNRCLFRMRDWHARSFCRSWYRPLGGWFARLPMQFRVQLRIGYKVAQPGRATFYPVRLSRAAVYPIGPGRLLPITHVHGQFTSQNTRHQCCYRDTDGTTSCTRSVDRAALFRCQIIGFITDLSYRHNYKCT